MTIINSIRACLDNHLSTMSSPPQIVFQNMAFNPNLGDTYVKATNIPRTRRPAVRGPNPQHRYEGTYLLLICTPEAQGSGAGYALADTLLERFNGSTSVSYGGLHMSINYSEVGTSFLDSPFYCTPVSVVWYAYN